MSRVLIRFTHPELGLRLGLRLGDHVHDITEHFASVSAWLNASTGRVSAAVDELEALAKQSPPLFPAALLDSPPAANRPYALAPVDDQDVWAAGVTYERSRAARQEEAVDGGDVYARVYAAERPELFFKAHGSRVVGPYGEVGIRADARWSVPEPELAVVLNPAMQVVGFTVGNDMSSRDIEGENPLYLPQAKIYTGSCALGPGIVLGAAAAWPDTRIQMTITRHDQPAFEGEVSVSRIHRTLDDLIDFLGRSTAYPYGVVLLTGTGIIPPDDFTLAAGDVVRIEIEGIGTLVNTVKVV